MTYCMVLVTCPDEAEAGKLAESIVSGRLAACVQIHPVTSVYTWDGRTEVEKEHRLVIKTRASVYPALEQFIVEHHSYEVPQIVRAPIEGGLDAYLGWIDENTRN